MRKTICTLLFRLGFVRLAYYVSPSVCGYLRVKAAAAEIVRALEVICGK